MFLPIKCVSFRGATWCACYNSFAIVVLCLTLSSIVGTRVKGREQVVFQSNTSGFPCTRIPAALAVPHTDVILAFAECRKWAGDQCFVGDVKNASRGGQFNRSICLRRSVDGGDHWGELQINITNRYSANPSALYHENYGQVMLFFDETTTGRMFYSASKDEGRTWGEAVSVKDSSGQEVLGVAGPGNSVATLSNGDMLIAAYHASRSWTKMFSYASVLRSKDGGVTWEDVSPFDTKMGKKMFPHLGEPSLTVLPNKGNVVVLDSRCPDGRRPYPGPSIPCDCLCRGVSVSTDGGETWGDMVYDKAVPDPNCQGAVLALRNESIAFSNANSPTHRINPSVRLGEVAANGLSVNWADTVTLLANEGTSAGYSSLFETSNGRIGVLWESEGDQPSRGCHGEGCSIVLSFL